MTFLSLLRRWISGPNTRLAVGEQQLVFNGGQLELRRWNGDNDQLQLNEVDIISFRTFQTEDPNSLRDFIEVRRFGLHPVWVNLNALGFDRLERWMRALPDFDAATYERARTLVGQQDLVHVLWQRKPESGYELLAEERNDIHNEADGLYLECRRIRLPWTSYHQLAKLDCVQSEIRPCPNPLFRQTHYTINSPVIFNGLHLDSLSSSGDAFEVQDKPHLPILNYHSEIRLGEDIEAEFRQLELHIGRHLAAIGGEAIESGRDLSGHLSSSWRHGRVSYSLKCFYDRDLERFFTHAWLSIDHDPELDAFLDTGYNRELQCGDQLQTVLIGGEIELAGNYRSVDDMLYTPECLTPMFSESQGIIIWHDQARERIGFAGRKLARVFDADSFSSISLAIQNFRGSEGVLSLELDNKTIATVSDSSAFKQRLEEIENVTGKRTGHYVYDDHY